MKSSTSRRSFLKTSAMALGAVAATGPKGLHQAVAADSTNDNRKARVFFTPDISANGLLKAHEKVGDRITGKVAIKVHTGEGPAPLSVLSSELATNCQ